MDNKKIGSFISTLRKEKGMTQKDLAEKLNVTDKAVSKWERGVGYPEITIIPILADTLGISTSELLLGEHIVIENEKKNTTIDIDKTDIIVDDVIEYAKQNNEDTNKRRNSFILVLLSSAFILSIFICMLCNYVISGSFDWSLYAVGGEAMAWIIIAPFLLFKEHRVITSLIGLSIGILPLLLLIEHLCPSKGWVFPLALPIVVISLISLWISAILFIYTKFNRYFLVSFEIVLFGVIVDLGVDIIVNHYLGKNLISIINLLKPAVFIAIAIIVAIVGKVQKQKS